MNIQGGKIKRGSQRRQGIDSEPDIIRTLQWVGIKSAQSILDFGCGSGTYTIPAGKIVGKQGRVYALDKDYIALDNLIEKVELAGLKNIKKMATSGELEIELPDESVDVSLIFDVFHRYYFPQIEDRKRLLDEIYRITKIDGFLSVWLKHMESEAGDEIKEANFYMEKEYVGTLIHDNKDIEKGKVINFRKKSGYG